MRERPAGSTGGRLGALFQRAGDEQFDHAFVVVAEDVGGAFNEDKAASTADGDKVVIFGRPVTSFAAFAHDYSGVL